MIDEALAGFIHGGLAAHLGTRDAALHPNGTRLTAVRVEPGGTHVVAFIPEAGADAVLADLESNGQAAIAMARPTDDRSCQIKGTFVSSAPAAEADRAFALAQWGAFLKQLEMVGLPPRATANWSSWPCVAVRLRVTALFNPTPGPDAGAALR
jgi:hypothetical protein